MDEGPTSKKQRTEVEDAIVVSEISQTELITRQPQPREFRTSSLQAPTMRLTGHSAAVYTARFNPEGDALASGSFDKSILLWDVHGECKNYNVLQGHTNAVLDLKWTPEGNKIVSASADKTVGVWDANAGKRIRKCNAHTACVNSVAMPQGKGRSHLFVSGSDDGSVRGWDIRSRKAVHALNHEYQILAVEMSEDGGKVYAGGIDNSIYVWDLRKKKEIVDVYEGHADTITGLALSPDGKYLLSNAMDNTLRQWDTRPFVSGSREVKMVRGAVHGSDRNLLRCSWSADGEMVTAGSSDRVVHIWDVPTTQALYALPGHASTVNTVVFHPKEPIIASASSDKTIFLGELA